jgi:molybdate transport system regulatory protein
MSNGVSIVAMITNASVTRLGLSVGKAATAVIKASSVLLMVGVAQLSARNQLSGKVKSVQDGAVNSEVTLELTGGVELVATITVTSRKSLGLAVGSDATAIIKATSVLVAV